MGVLQNSINSLLGTAAIAAKLSPKLEKQREISNLENKSDVYRQQITTQTRALYEKVPEDAPERVKKDLKESREKAFEGRQGSYEKLIETQKQAFDIDPSMERYQKLEKTIYEANKFAEDRAKAKAIQSESMKERRSILLDAMGQNIIVKGGK